jgi:CO/xanthine dehydrogenase FAD-binding subunit
MYEPLWEHPETVGEVEEILAEAGDRARLIAGGTDLAVAIKRGDTRPEILVDLGRVAGLADIDAAPGGDEVEIGALATHARLARHPVLLARATALAQACRAVGSPQIRARGTIGGNVVNASPAADGAVALTAFGATVKVREAYPSRRGTKVVPLEEFLLGPGSVALGPSEFVSGVTLRLPDPGARSVYMKVGQRSALAIAIASAAVVFAPSAGRVRIALGSVAPTPVRATAAEALFAAEWEGATDRAELIGEVAAKAVESTSCIDDVRASAWYRADLVRALTRRALTRLIA